MTIPPVLKNKYRPPSRVEIQETDMAPDGSTYCVDIRMVGDRFICMDMVLVYIAREVMLKNISYKLIIETIKEIVEELKEREAKEKEKEGNNDVNKNESTK